MLFKFRRHLCQGSIVLSKRRLNCLIKLVRALLHFHLSQCKMQIADYTLQIGENYIQSLKNIGMTMSQLNTIV